MLSSNESHLSDMSCAREGESQAQSLKSDSAANKVHSECRLARAAARATACPLLHGHPPGDYRYVHHGHFARRNSRGTVNPARTESPVSQLINGNLTAVFTVVLSADRI
jgi:hypothetical protein